MPPLPVPNRLCRTGQACRFTMNASRTAQLHQDLQRVRNDLKGLDLDGARVSAS